MKDAAQQFIAGAIGVTLVGFSLFGGANSNFSIGVGVVGLVCCFIGAVR